MRPSRVILGVLLVYQALFLNVLLPGHTRGAMTTDGRHAAAPCCCCGGGGDADRPPTGKEPSQRDRDHCAICQFAAGLISVPPVRLDLDDLGPLHRVPAPPPAVALPRDPVPTYLACGPPASSAHV